MGRSVELEVAMQGKMEIGRPKTWLNEFSRVGVAEFLSTYIMMTLGLGSVAQVVTGKGGFGTFFSINVGFGLAVAMGVHIGGTVSGAHMNAAVSFALCVFGQLPWKRLPLYVFAQLIGSFLAAATVYGIYYDAISSYSGGNLTVTGERATAGIFATYPAPYLSVFGGFVDQVFGTAILLLCLMALSDEKNKPAAKGAESIFVGLLVTLIGISLGSNSGYAINPTRDFGPRLFTAMAGWGFEGWKELVLGPYTGYSPRCSAGSRGLQGMCTNAPPTRL
ncbi:aquaporin-7 isoform X2 [Poeciliopsis prolifica]|uniref:aquaporin-7 isoform X2 n=1 Tax=Poeciliopsis prolifica TaxID=188132 RepID=UPI0024135B2E|nr:aquaporin-7 isoform X2 [Poeciliopsis prolifica]